MFIRHCINRLSLTLNCHGREEAHRVHPHTTTRVFHRVHATCPEGALSRVLTQPSLTWHLSGASLSESISLQDLQLYFAIRPTLIRFTSALPSAWSISPSPQWLHLFLQQLALIEHLAHPILNLVSL